MSRKQRILSLLAALVVASGVTTMSATPANAAINSCNPTYWENRFCVWKVPGHNGSPDYYWTINSGSGGLCVNYGAGLNDNVDALVLSGGYGTGRSVTQYRDANCSGNALSFHYGQKTGNSPWYGNCGSGAWACTSDGWGSYLPSSAWIIR